MRRVAAAALPALVLLVSSFAAAQTTVPTRDELVRMLSTFESSPSSARWRAMGDRMVSPLVEIYGDRSLPPYVRLRALVAVGAFHTRAARATLVAAATSPHTPEMHAREAVLALGRTFGAEALDELAARLDDTRPLVREAAARALSRIRVARARTIVRERLRSEVDPVIRDALAGR
ncbi:MAG: HEAT repeat domain-containing protein [Deltaproteobacteria bacterium]|nr:HEAT repeat domain-containing protein [Deltaproteobacteria bacterium]